mgnify:FL=1|jgi:23S rRNA pseudouridine2605 synthase
MVKLNVYLARSGVASRRKADELIKKGKVSLNGKVVILPYADVGENDSVSVGNRKISVQKSVYIALNKPEGYTCTLKDRFAERKVTELLPPSMGKIFPAGRLDKNSSGLIILTTDGLFAQQVTHPSYEVEKEYEATVTPSFDRRHIGLLKRGITDKGENLRASSGRMVKDYPSTNQSVVSIIMKEGRKREVRRMFERLRYSVISLKRVRIGNIQLGQLAPGSYRSLTPEEISFFTKRVARKKADEKNS